MTFAKSILTSTVMFLFVGLFVTSCTHDPIVPQIDDPDPTTSQDCDPDTVYFVNEVLPLLQSSCAQSGCHNAQSQEDGVILDNYENIMKTGKVKSRDPEDSDLYEVLIETEDDLMPPKSNGGPLASEQINLVKKWIEQGALNNECSGSECDTLTISFEKQVQPIFVSNCQGCHNNANASANVNLEGYNNIKTSIEQGKVMPSIRHKSGYMPMPDGLDKLEKCDIRSIAIWVDNGMPNN